MEGSDRKGEQEEQHTRDQEVERYLAAQREEVIAFRAALTAESDRGCALFAAAYLDASLSDLLYVSLVSSKKIEDDIFKGTAPLATFSSRIKMAYYLGLISPACRRDLDIIRSVRNDFAHKLEANSFEIPPTRDRCRTLVFSFREKQDDARSQFTASAMAILAHVHAATLSTTPHAERLDDTPSQEDKAKHRKRVEDIAQRLRERTDDDAAEK